MLCHSCFFIACNVKTVNIRGDIINISPVIVIYFFYDGKFMEENGEM